MTAPIPAEEVIRKEVERWTDCEGVKHMSLLRLSLLRELIQRLHSEKSRCLATGNRSQAEEIKNWEVRIEELRDGLQLPGDLFELIQKSSSLPKKKRILPESLTQALGRGKLDRYDRSWEAAIAAEAVTLHWRFWSLDAWVKIPDLEYWNQTLIEKLWPHGVVLFVESSNMHSTEILKENEEPAFWRGSWIVVLDHHFRSPSDLSLHIQHWPGAVKNAPTPFQWKQIYP